MISKTQKSLDDARDTRLVYANETALLNLKVVYHERVSSPRDTSRVEVSRVELESENVSESVSTTRSQRYPSNGGLRQDARNADKTIPTRSLI